MIGMVLQCWEAFPGGQLSHCFLTCNCVPSCKYRRILGNTSSKYGIAVPSKRCKGTALRSFQSHRMKRQQASQTQGKADRRTQGTPLLVAHVPLAASQRQEGQRSTRAVVSACLTPGHRSLTAIFVALIIRWRGKVVVSSGSLSKPRMDLQHRTFAKLSSSCSS